MRFKMSLASAKRPLLFLKDQTLLVASFMVLMQLAFALSFSRGEGLLARYLNLCEWDGKHYAHIVRYGYQSYIPLVSPIAQGEQSSNVAFFPAFPYLARVFYLLLGGHEALSLLGVAQISSLLFWYFLMKRLRRARIPGVIQGLALTLIWIHPASFYLVMPYSESLFLVSLLSFLHFSERIFRKADFRNQLLASLAGFLLVGTRIIGVSLAIFPIVLELLKRRPKLSGLLRATSLTVTSLSALLLFFAYCQIQFGNWSLYFLSQWVGWGVKADIQALWMWANYSYLCYWDRWALESSLCGALAILGVEAIFFLSGISRRGILQRLPLYFLIVGMMVITIVGLYRKEFLSVIRYSFPWYVLFILNLTQLGRQLLRRKPGSKRYLSGAVFGMFLAAACFFQQVTLFGLKRYLIGWWFA